MQSERTQKTLPWEPITRIQAGGGKSRTVRFEYEGAPYLGSQFQIGWNLTHEESEAIARLITDYRASHLTA